MKFQVHDIQLYNQGYIVFGRTAESKSVAIHIQVENLSYFFVRPRDGNFKKIGRLVGSLNQKIKVSLDKTRTKAVCLSSQCTCNEKEIGMFGPDAAGICLKQIGIYSENHMENISGYEIVEGKTMIGYNKENQTFAKVYCRSYGILKIVKTLLISNYNSFFKEYEPFEANIDPICRFTADNDIVGFGFIEIEDRHLKYTTPVTRADK